MKLIATVGLPASGKTTWAREFVTQNDQWIRVNRDDLRNMRGKYWVPSQEDLITQWENWCVLLALQNGYHVVLDATNLNKDRLMDRVKMFREQCPDLKFERKFFDTPVDECLRRDAKRADGVGEKVIINMYDKYLKPELPKYDEDTSLPHCIICDIDGTLAKMRGRSPFEWKRVGEDILNVPVAKVLDGYDGDVILLSGRDSVCRIETETWLSKHDIPYSKLYMRDEGSMEADEKVKRRMFDEYIRGKYYCDFVIDDRDKVVRMWREDIGLVCMQVDYGNF